MDENLPLLAFVECLFPYLQRRARNSDVHSMACISEALFPYPRHTFSACTCVFLTSDFNSYNNKRVTKSWRINFRTGDTPHCCVNWCRSNMHMQISLFSRSNSCENALLPIMTHCLLIAELNGEISIADIEYWQQLIDVGSSKKNLHIPRVEDYFVRENSYTSAETLENKVLSLSHSLAFRCCVLVNFWWCRL